MKEKESLVDRLDRKRDAFGEKLSSKEFAIPTEIIAGCLFLLLGVVVLVMMPAQVAVSEGDVVNGRAFPKLLMTVMMLFSAVLLLKEGYRVLIKKQPPVTKTINLYVELKALVILGILLVTFLICQLTEMFILGACFCSLSFLIYFRCRKGSYYAITLGMTVLIWAAFRFGLNVRF